MSRNLIITRAGPDSLHRSWLNGERDFDLLLARYCETPFLAKERGIFESYIPGSKVAGWNALFQSHPYLLERYDRIALLDDDIRADATSLTRCFSIGERYGLAIWQPSLSWESYVTYAATLRNPSFELRYLNGVEMMCPFFEASALKRVLPLFGLGFESGIDLVWCSLFRERQRKFAVIDIVSVTHTKPVGGEKAKNGFVERTYETDIDRCLSLFGMVWPSLVSEDAVKRNGAIVHGKTAIGLSALSLLCSVFYAPKSNRVYRLKAASDHIRHQLTRPAAYAEDVEGRFADMIPQNAEARGV